MHTQKNTILKVLVLVIILAVFIINSDTITAPARIRFTDLASRPLSFISSVFSSFQKVIPFASLREENRLLREKIKILNRKLESVKTLYVENERLRSLLDFRKAIPYTTIPALVIGRDPSNWSNSIIVNKGLVNGLKQNKAVISTNGLVGRIVELGRYSSKILLITDPNSRVGVVIERNRHGGILMGRPDGKCKMIYIALDSDVSAGDRVITAGSGSIFPKDILVGQVVKVDKEPARLYKYAIVKTSEDLSRLEEVMCIR